MQQSVYITAIGTFLPNAPVDNESMEPLLGVAGGRPSRARAIVLRNNGIETRYYAIDPTTGRRSHSNAGMTAAAVRALDLPPMAIDALACGTASPDQLLPSHAVMVHGELRLPVCEVASFAGICVSGMQAMKHGYLLVQAGEAQCAVATGSELASASMRGERFAAELESRSDALGKEPMLAFGKDFLRWMLSDGAGAVALMARPNPTGLSLRIDWIDMHSFAGELPACMHQGAEQQPDGALAGYRDFSDAEIAARSLLALQQDVKLLNEQIIAISTRALRRSAERHDLDPAAIDWFLPHLSSLYFRERLHADYLAAGFDIPLARWFTNLAEVGNVGSASIYLMLDALWRSGQLKAGQKLLLMVPESGRFTMSFTQLTVVADGEQA